FRWRLLSYGALLSMIVIGYALSFELGRWRGMAAALLAIVCIVDQLPTLYPMLYQQTNDFPTWPTVADAQDWEIKKALPGLTVFDELRPLWRNEPLADAAARGASGPIGNLPSGARLSLDDRRNGAW